MKTLVAVILILSSFNVQASKIDILGIPFDNNVLEHTTTALIMLDLGTTLDIENHPDQYESSKQLGKHPTRSEVYKHFAIKLGTHYLINEYFPEVKNIWNVYQTYITYNAVSGNFQAGLRINF